MADSYQAIYDAVRSRISNGDIGRAVADVAFQTFDISHARGILQEQIYSVAQEMMRPSVLWKPQLSLDGTKWCALYGTDLMDGIAGFGDTPAEAMADFDQQFWKGRTPAAMRQIVDGEPGV